jgi:hypothetical protein
MSCIPIMTYIEFTLARVHPQIQARQDIDISAKKMSNLGDLQKRSSEIFAEAKAQGLQPQDVIPAEVQAYFQNTTELKTAKEYIKQLEENERSAYERSEGLEKELKQAKKALDDLPDDHNMRMVELGQAEHRVKFFQDLMNAAEERAVNYQKKWQEALAKQSAAHEKDEKIQRLEKEAVDYQLAIRKLADENRDLENIFEKIREKDLKALEAKELKLMEKEEAVRDIKEKYLTLADESNRFEETYTELVTTMDMETVHCAEAINKTALKLEHANIRIRENDQLRMATVSEIQPLRRFYERCFDILLIHQRIFQQLFSIKRQEVSYLPDALQATLKSATSELEVFHAMRQAMEIEGIAEDEVRDQLTAMSFSACRLHGSLQAISGDVMRFLKQLDERPSTLTLMRFKFKKLLR